MGPRARGERHVLHRTEEVRLPAAASRPLPESTYLHISEG